MQDHNLSSFSLCLNIIAPLLPTLTHQKQELQGWVRASVHLMWGQSLAVLIRGSYGNLVASSGIFKKKIKVPSQWLWRVCFPPSPVCPLYLCQPLGSVALGSWFLCTAGTHFFHSVLPLSNCIDNSHCACIVVVAQGRTNIFPLTVIAASPDVSSSYTSWGKNR